MKESRHQRVRGERKPQLSPDAERMVAAALGLANSGSRVEDGYWEQILSARVERLLDGGHPQSIYDALERLTKTDSEAYGALVEVVEETAESMVLELDGRAWQVLLVTVPVVAWTRFKIPTGPIPAAESRAITAHLQAHILADGARFAMVPALYSIDQFPRDFCELRKLCKRLGNAAIVGAKVRSDAKSFPETADMLADARFLIGAVAVPVGSPVFRWQDLEAKDYASRVQCLEQWIAQGRPNLEPLLQGCGFECLLPDAYHINMRESDRRVRPFAIRAAVHFLIHALNIDAGEIRATVAAFGEERVDEYRIGLSVDEDGEDVVQGMVWPLLGTESESDDTPPIEQIRETLREAGVTDVRLWPEMTEPDYCEDCGAPLFPNGKGDVVHAEMPSDIEPESAHFH